jgi:hypothetical protein
VRSSAEPPPLCLGSRETGANPFRDSSPFKLRDSRQDVHLQLASRRGGIDAFSKRHERDTERLQVFE